MNEFFFMQVFQTLYELQADDDNGFEGEFFITFLKKFFQRWPKEIHDHDMGLVVLAIIMEPGESLISGIDLIGEICE